MRDALAGLGHCFRATITGAFWAGMAQRFKCYKNKCYGAVSVTPGAALSHADPKKCSCGHLNKYCAVCDAFFERVKSEPEPASQTRMGYHFRNHTKRQNFADRQFYLGPSVYLAWTLL